jgi:hypothetical protein
VHDSKQAVAFLREVIDDLRGRVDRRVALEFRMDAAFFQQAIFPLLAARECFYAIKVGYWSWLPLKQVAAACRRWEPVAPGVGGHETELVISQWNNVRLRVVPYRKHVNHETGEPAAGDEVFQANALRRRRIGVHRLALILARERQHGLALDDDRGAEHDLADLNVLEIALPPAPLADPRTK